MLAQDNQYFKEASETVYSLSKEEQIRQQCWAREDYYRTIRAYNKDIADLKSEISKKDQQLMEKDALIAALQAQLAEKGSKEQKIESCVSIKGNAALVLLAKPVK